jgi:hypothetical protein
MRIGRPGELFVRPSSASYLLHTVFWCRKCCFSVRTLVFLVCAGRGQYLGSDFLFQSCLKNVGSINVNDNYFIREAIKKKACLISV